MHTFSAIQFMFSVSRYFFFPFFSLSSHSDYCCSCCCCCHSFKLILIHFTKHRLTTYYSIVMESCVDVVVDYHLPTTNYNQRWCCCTAYIIARTYSLPRAWSTVYFLHHQNSNSDAMLCYALYVSLCWKA